MGSNTYDVTVPHDEELKNSLVDTKVIEISTEKYNEKLKEAIEAANKILEEINNKQDTTRSYEKELNRLLNRSIEKFVSQKDIYNEIKKINSSIESLEDARKNKFQEKSINLEQFLEKIVEETREMLDGINNVGETNVAFNEQDYEKSEQTYAENKQQLQNLHHTFATYKETLCEQKTKIKELGQSISAMDFYKEETELRMQTKADMIELCSVVPEYVSIIVDAIEEYHAYSTNLNKKLDAHRLQLDAIFDDFLKNLTGLEAHKSKEELSELKQLHVYIKDLIKNYDTIKTLMNENQNSKDENEKLNIEYEQKARQFREKLTSPSEPAPFADICSEVDYVEEVIIPKPKKFFKNK